MQPATECNKQSSRTPTYNTRRIETVADVIHFMALPQIIPTFNVKDKGIHLLYRFHGIDNSNKWPITWRVKGRYEILVAMTSLNTKAVQNGSGRRF
jgi:hypothetical protein